MIRMISAFLARFFLSLIFICSGTGKLFNWQDTERNLLTALCDWQVYVGYFLPMQECMASLVPWSTLLLLLTVLLELSGGLMILFSYKEKIGAGLLIILIIPVTLVFHPFWFLEGSSKEIQSAMFLKNLAILGGLILVTLHGTKTRDHSDFSARH